MEWKTGPPYGLLEYAEEWRLPVVGSEPAAELGICDEVPPPLADGCGSRKGGRTRRNAEEDLFEHIIVL